VNHVAGPAQDLGRLVPALGWHEDQVGVVGRGDEDRERSLRHRVYHSRQHAGHAVSVVILCTSPPPAQFSGGGGHLLARFLDVRRYRLSGTTPTDRLAVMRVLKV
jgi:hypothetical protein